MSDPTDDFEAHNRAMRHLNLSDCSEHGFKGEFRRWEHTSDKESRWAKRDGGGNNYRRFAREMRTTLKNPFP